MKTVPPRSVLVPLQVDPIRRRAARVVVLCPATGAVENAARSDLSAFRKDVDLSSKPDRYRAITDYGKCVTKQLARYWAQRKQQQQQRRDDKSLNNNNNSWLPLTRKPSDRCASLDALVARRLPEAPRRDNLGLWLGEPYEGAPIKRWKAARLSI